jgi:hypothetical protein
LKGGGTLPSYKTSDFDPINQRNLKALDNGGTTEFWIKGKVCAIGNGHKPDLMADLKKGGAKATLVITKGTMTNPGQLEVKGLSGQRSEFEDTIKRISKKKVVFK